MSGLIELAGDAALLLWGTHMVTSGVQRGYGALLRERLARAVQSPFRAFAVGLAVTVALQSSTATGLMAASFTAEGIVGLTSGYRMMLGANVGTALVARALSFPIVALAPLAILLGVGIFRRSRADRARNVGRIAIGLGLMLLALHGLVEVLSPIGTDPVAIAVEHWVFQQPWLTMAAAAFLAWLCHSSMAVVLMAAALGHAQGLSADVAIALMLGANLGAAIPPVMEVSTVEARRLPLGNLLVRAAGVLAVLGTAPLWVPFLPQGWSDEPAFIADAHLLFNLLLALAAAPMAAPMGRLLQHWLPSPPAPEDAGIARCLDVDVLEQPHLALVQAERETIRMADCVQILFTGALDVLRTGDTMKAAQLQQDERAMARLSLAIRRYLANMKSDSMAAPEERRRQDIQRFVIDLENQADVVAHGLVHTAINQKRDRLAFSDQEWSDIEAMAQDVRGAFRLAMAVFAAQDVRAARALVGSKPVIRDRERALLITRQAALHSADPMASRTGDRFLRVMRDLKRIHSLLTGVAYQTLESAGQLQPRLQENPAVEPVDSPALPPESL